MAAQEIPATIVVRRTWVKATFAKRPYQSHATIEKSMTSAVTHAAHKYVGDSEGNPNFLLELNQDPQEVFVASNALADPENPFNEILTREDGTRVAFLDLLDEKLHNLTTTDPTS